jgi:hypothetical protein
MFGLPVVRCSFHRIAARPAQTILLPGPAPATSRKSSVTVKASGRPGWLLARAVRGSYRIFLTPLIRLGGVNLAAVRLSRE